MKKYCRSCALYAAQKSVCRLTGLEVNPEVDYCSRQTAELHMCEHCGHPAYPPILDVIGDKVHIFCTKCGAQLSSCAFCKNADKCDFETNPSSLPKVVQKQVRQGNMVSVMQVKNPDRIRETCQKGCPCFDSENGCMKQFNYCKGLEYIYD